MRFAIFVPMALCVAALMTVDAVSNESDKVSVLVSTHQASGQDEVVDSVMEPMIIVGQDVDGPFLDGPMMPHQAQRVPAASLVPGMVLPSPAVSCCTVCCEVRCCCKKVPTTANFCLIDPDGCEIEFCARVPECCVGHQPHVSWRCGALGRKVATLCWDCCDQTVKVVVTRRGKVRVRD